MADEDTYNLRWNTASEQFNTAVLEGYFAIAKGMNAKLMKDGEQWCWIYGELPEPNCIVGFGDTPHRALCAFCYFFNTGKEADGVERN